jgi:hypothetical protein
MTFASAALERVLLILLSPVWSVVCFYRPSLLSPGTFFALVAVISPNLLARKSAAVLAVRVARTQGLEQPEHELTNSRPHFQAKHPSLACH